MFLLTWMRNCWWPVLHCQAGWPALVLLKLPGLLRQRQTNQRGSRFISDSSQRPEEPHRKTSCARTTSIKLKETPSAAHPVLPVRLGLSAASAGCGSCFPAGSAGLPLHRGRTVRGRCRHRCLALQEWEGCSGTRSPYDRTPHPCRFLAPDETI